MRRSLWVRIVTAIWAVWLGTALATPMAMHPMQMAGQMAGMHGMPGMDQSAGSDVPTDHMPSHGSSNDCSCICNCCCVPPAIAPSRVATGIETRLVAPQLAVPVNADARGPAALPPYSLPFANGPPAEFPV